MRRSPECFLTTIPKSGIAPVRSCGRAQTLIRNGVGKDFPWARSAREYGKIYERARQARAVPEKVLV